MGRRVLGSGTAETTGSLAGGEGGDDAKTSVGPAAGGCGLLERHGSGTLRRTGGFSDVNIRCRRLRRSSPFS